MAQTTLIEPSAPEFADRTASPDHVLTVDCFGMTHPGRVRPRNEDQFLAARLTKAMHVLHTSLPQPRIQHSEDQSYLFLVADGLGGHAGGERASALAVDTIGGLVLNAFKWFFQLQGPEEDEVLREFKSALHQADESLFAEVSRYPELAGMGTTLTAAYVLGAHAFIAHVGDSRCYLIRGGNLQRVTSDHTMANELVRSGALSAEALAGHPYRHVVTNVVGGHTPGIHVEVHRLELEPGDRLQLCTDGLTEMVSEREIADVIARHAEPKDSCERLVELANQRGGKDNITAVLAHFD